MLLSVLQPQAWRQGGLTSDVCGGELLLIELTPDNIHLLVRCHVDVGQAMLKVTEIDQSDT